MKGEVMQELVKNVNAEALRDLIANGLTFGEAVNIFAESRSDDELKFVAAAAEKHAHDEGDLEVDHTAATSENDDGAYVMCWTYISNEDAGVVTNEEEVDPAEAAAEALEAAHDDHINAIIDERKGK